jgi:hypothetical protein
LRNFGRDPARRAYSLAPLADGRLLYRENDFLLLGPDGALLANVDLTPGRRGYEQICPDGVVYYQQDRDHHRSILGWDLGAGEPVPRFTIPELAGFTTYSLTFALAPDLRTMFVAYDHRWPRVVFEVGADRELRNPLTIPEAGEAYLGRFSPDGRTLALLHLYPSWVGLWDVPGRAIRVNKIVCSSDAAFLDFHPTAPVFTSLNPDGVLTLYSTETGEAIRSLDFALGKKVTCVRFSPDGLTCAVGGSNKQFAVFDVDV